MRSSTLCRAVCQLFQSVGFFPMFSLRSPCSLLRHPHPLISGIYVHHESRIEQNGSVCVGDDAFMSGEHAKMGQWFCCVVLTSPSCSSDWRRLWLTCLRSFCAPMCAEYNEACFSIARCLLQEQKVVGARGQSWGLMFSSPSYISAPRRRLTFK